MDLVEAYAKASSLRMLIARKLGSRRSFVTNALHRAIDCVIAKLAADHDALILSKDRDLALIIESKILEVRPMPIV